MFSNTTKSLVAELALADSVPSAAAAAAGTWSINLKFPFDVSLTICAGEADCTATQVLHLNSVMTVPWS
jgi:hypothetical protein